MATPEQKAQAANETAYRILKDALGYSAGMQPILQAKIAVIIEEHQAAERASWQQRERVYREALEDAKHAAINPSGIKKENYALAAKIRDALNQSVEKP